MVTYKIQLRGSNFRVSKQVSAGKYILASLRDAEALFFCGTPTRGLENLGLQTPTPTFDLLCGVYFKDNLRQILNSCNKKCTIVRKQSFSCKINYTEIKYVEIHCNKITHKSR